MAARRKHARTKPAARPDESDARAHRERIIFIVFIALTTLCYLPTLSYPFIYDDYDSIVEHPIVLGELPLYRSLIDPPPGPTAARPIVCLSFVANYALGELEPTGYRLVNIAIHVCCGLLLFGILRRTLARAAAGSFSSLVAGRFAGAVTLLWLLHPLQTESVTFVTQRTELLMAVFLLATLYCAIRSVEAEHGSAWNIIAIACCFVGMGCKEVMAVAPLAVFLYDRTFLAGGFRAALAQRRSLYMGLAASWLVVAYLIATSPRSSEVGFGHGVGVLDSLFTQAVVIVHYLRLALWPHPLVIIYDDWPIAQHLVQVWPYALTVTVLLAFTVWAIVRRPAFGFVGAWFFLILAPSSSFVPILTELAAERRMYLPLVAVILPLAVFSWVLIRWGTSRVFPRRLGVPVTLAVVLLAATASTLATLARNRVYRSRISVWQDALRKRPASAHANLNVGALLLGDGKYHDAIQYFERSLQFRPEYSLTHFNLGLAYTRIGDFEKAAAQFRQAVQADPEFWEARVNLANSYHRLARLDDAAALYAALLQERPDEYTVRANLGTVRMKQGRFADAEKEYRLVVRQNPAHTFTIQNLGDVLLRQGKYESAAVQFQAAIRLDPSQADSYYKLGGIRFQQGMPDAAIDLAQTALRLDPQHASARRLLQAALSQGSSDNSP